MIQAEKIVIDQNGLLSIQRMHNDKPLPMVCPFRQGHHYCGEWCPMFGEIEERNPRSKYLFYSISLDCAYNDHEIHAKKFTRMNDTRNVDHLAEFKNIMDEAHVDCTNVHWENPPEVKHVK